MVSAIEPIAVVMKPDARNGFRISSSVATPTSPATTNAASSDAITGQPSHTLAMKPANAPIVMCEASAKFVNRSTAKMAVSPIAGTARIVPAISPFKMSCRTSMCRASRWRELPQSAGLLDEARHLGGTLARLQVGEHERPLPAHALGVLLHHLERC